MALNFPASPSTGSVHNASNGLQYHFDGVKWVSQGAYNTSTINTLNFTQQGTGAVSRSVQNKLEELVSVKDFGAKGDGTTDDTAAIESALTYWASKEGVILVFPEGLYIDTGGHVHALGDKQFNAIKMAGQLRPTNTTGVCWQITGVENVCLELRLDGGGTLGNFTNATPIGGSTFLKMHTVRWGKIYIEAMNYAGRVVHFTAGGTDQATRCRMLDVNIKTGNRNVGASDEPVGQPFFVDSGSCVQTGAIGKFAFRGEGCYYGPVFERLNDIDITNLEAGKFITTGIEVRGCVMVHADTIFIGESDASGGANTATIKFISTSAGRLCSNIYIDKLTCLNATDGVYCTGFDPDSSGLVINTLNVSNSTRAIQIVSMPNVVISDLSGKTLTELVSTSGTCGDIDIKVSKVGTVTQNVFFLNSTQTSFKISGVIRGGASGYSLINILQGDGINLIDLHLQSSVCTQLINIASSGLPNIRQVGGSVSGTSSVYTSGKRLKYVENVAGLQTFSNGEATFASGQTTTVINTGLDLTPQVISVIGIDPEVAAIYLTSVSGANITVAVASAVTGNRLIYWTANSISLRGDLSL